MSFQTPITVKEAVENIHAKKYLLPAIQREVVWEVDQITRLFDSLMRDYPIGSFLFWHVEKKNVGQYQFYEFVRDYHERNMCHNPKADVSGEDDITAILDGQQRLTSLYLGLKGSYAYKEPRKRWDNPRAYPVRRLYINLLGPKKNGDETDMVYDFAFLTDEEASTDGDDVFWFKVGEVLNLKEHWEVNDYLISHELAQKPQDQARFANRTLFKLWSVVHEAKVINYFLEKDESLDKVLNIFIRVNSSGTILSYSDLLLSVATAQWKKRDAREEITSFVDELNGMGDGFNFNKDFVLKSCLVLADFTDIAFKVDNFNKANMLNIEEQWDDIEDALRGAVSLVAGFGYSRDTLTANYPVIPIAYYLKARGLPKNFDTSAHYAEDREAIRRWFILSLVKRVFGGSPDTVLRPVRKMLREARDGFPYQDIVHRFKGTTRSLVCTEDDVENLLRHKYGKGYTFSVLALLYPTLDFRNRFHIDHIHPRSKFKKPKLRQKGIRDADIEFYLENVDLLPNLQLLEGIPNQEKSDMDFADWLARTCKSAEERANYMKRHFIPNVDLSFSNFREFVEKRKALLREELRRILHVTKEE
ncbi:Protein of unknown function DUF262 [Sulfurivirga caldicuralii]|uniref:GmrSD restriction endonucleases N-terminal domain-containing protein n=1 Tax=Sulfurivirga caldicuralii TaxID=364032 RepID=A0A1N6GIQ5_9GAMM|nr:DUF262 domain-containing protein [Sulfurivirga caldicuralii]SIO07396.1 Protein of unknown function DUF262 [Sulfurivirga caldicuralii]